VGALNILRRSRGLDFDGILRITFRTSLH